MVLGRKWTCIKWGDWETEGHGHSGTRTQPDWDTTGMGRSGTVTQWERDTAGMGHREPATGGLMHQ